MANPRVAWGIDIGNRALKAVKLVRKAEGIVIDDIDVIEHENILSNAGDNRDALIQAALTQFTTKHAGLKGAIAAVGVSGQQSFARFIKLPPVEEKKIPEIVRFEAIQQIPFPLDEVEWSYQLFKDEASPEVEVGIFAMRRELVNQHLAFFTAAGLNIQAVQMTPLADYNALAYDDKIQGATMIIDLGAENADLIIAEGETVWMRSIPIGGNHFTETLVRDFKLRFERAEELKRTTATSPHGRRILQAMRPVFADLVSEIQRSIGFYSSTHRDSRISRVIALGGTFKLPGLQKYLQQNLGLEVVKLDTLGQAPPSDGKIAAALSENVLSCVSAYGLALQALGEAKITSSLLPQMIQKERMWQQKTKWFAATAACFVIGVGLAYWQAQTQVSDYESAEAREMRSKAANELSAAKQLINQYQEQSNAGAEDRQTIQEVKTLSEYRDIWPVLYTEINAALPAPKAVLDKAKGVETKAAAATPAAPKPASAAGGGAKPPASAAPATNPAAGAEAIKKYGERRKREEVVLEDLEVVYDPNIGTLVAREQRLGIPPNSPDLPFLVSDVEFNARVGTRDPALLVGIRARHPNMLSGTSPGGGVNPGAVPFAPDGGRGGVPMPYIPPSAVQPNYAQPLPGTPGAGPQKRGFLVTLHLTTPNEGGLQFVNQTLVAKLMANEKVRQAIADQYKAYATALAAKQPANPPTEPKADFSIARITVPQFIQLKDDQQRQVALARRAKEQQDRKLKLVPGSLNVPGEGGGAGGNVDIRQLVAPPTGAPGADITAPDGGVIPGLPPIGVPGIQTDPNQLPAEELAKFLVDPITGEDIREDYTVTVLVAVVLDPFVEPPAVPPAEGDPAAEGDVPPAG